MTSTIETIRTGIVTKLNSVEGAGRVHAYQRYIGNAKDFADLYTVTDEGGETPPQVKGWFVSRVSTREYSKTVGRTMVDHTWRIQGFMALDDAAGSRLAFDDLIEAVRDAVRADPRLGGVCATTNIEGVAGVQVEEVGDIWFLKNLCHGAKLRLVTRHFL